MQDFVVEQDAPQHPLLGLEVLRRQAIGERRPGRPSQGGRAVTVAIPIPISRCGHGPARLRASRAARPLRSGGRSPRVRHPVDPPALRRMREDL